MRIPIRNIYYLLCYAWDRLDEAEEIDVSIDDAESLVNLLARVLITGTSHLLKKGLDRGYMSREDAIPGIRGKLAISETIRHQLLIKGQTFCVYDELTHDISHNRVLRTTLLKTAQAEGVDPQLRDELRGLYRRLGGIADNANPARDLRSIQLHRNNRSYALLLQVCSLLQRNLLPSEKPGSVRFRDFTRDEKEMAMLFQAFAYHFFKRKQHHFEVSSPRFGWLGVEGSDEALLRLPSMQTDIVLSSLTRRLVIDTKFYKQPFQQRYDRKTAISSHLYQIVSYVQNIPQGENLLRSEGILLYPTVDEDFELKYVLNGYRITLRSVDLAQHWAGIEQEMLSIVA